MAPPTRAQFDTTHWSVVLAAGHDNTSGGQEALAALCESYWFPLYAYVRRQGFDQDDARDLTQSFFASLLARRDLRQVRPERGRFRSFLLAALRHFLINERKQRKAAKRGGGVPQLSLEWECAETTYLREPVDPGTPETLFNRRWASSTIAAALDRLRKVWRRAGKETEFELLHPSLVGELERGSYGSLAERLQTTEGAVRVAVHRLRREFQEQLREQVAQTVTTAEALEDELRFLLDALQE